MTVQKPWATTLSEQTIRDLRSDHAGETGAVFIYKGIIAIASLKKDSQLIKFASEHGRTESEHLKLMEGVLPQSEWSSFLIPWRCAGWLTGALSALISRNAVYATIEAVETFVDSHYQQQINQLQSSNAERDLLSLLERCQQDECHHRDEAARLGSTHKSFWLRYWCYLIGVGSYAAVALARRF